MHPNTFEQLRVFREVAAAGSFSDAAKALGKAVSAVTYAIGNLEAQFDLVLFDRSGYRPELTPAGKTLYKDTINLFRRLERFEARVDTLKNEDVAVLRVAHDLSVPSCVMARALSALSEEFPHVDIRLEKIRTKDIGETLKDMKVDVGIIALFDALQFDGVDGQQIGASDTPVICVPDHPIAKMKELQLPDLDRYRQLVLLDDVPEPGDENYFIHSNDYWSTDDFDMFRALLLKGKGWAWVHRKQVLEDLDAGRLVEVSSTDVKEVNRRRYSAVWPVKKPGGPIVRRFIEHAVQAFED